MTVTLAANDLPLTAAVLDELKKNGLPAHRLAQAQVFCRAFFARMAEGDALLHGTAQWAELLGSLLDFMQQRQFGHAAVRVVNPAGLQGGRSLLQIVTDDMPFLVDTVSMIAAAQLQIHAVIHPVLRVARDAAGQLQGLGDEAAAFSE